MLSKSTYALCWVTVALGCSSAPTDTAYFPGPGDGWEHRAPADVGMDSLLLAEAGHLRLRASPTLPAISNRGCDRAWAMIRTGG